MESDYTVPPVTKIFTYTYTHHDGTNRVLKYPVPIPLSSETVNELAHRIVDEKMDSIMKILDAHLDMQPKLNEFISQQRQQILCEADDIMLNAARMGATDIDLIVRNMDNKYKDEVLEFATKIGPSDDEIFAQSFHRLVHSSSMLEILMKEQNYAKTIIEMNQQRDLEISGLINEQQNEMEAKIEQLDIGTTSDDINNLLSRHYSRQNLVQKQWESELEAKMGHQKNEYRNWIVGMLSQTFCAKNEQMASPSCTSASGSESDRASMFVMQVPAMEESFTIYLGSQLKHMHNMRLIAANIYDFCNLLHMNESISGPNIAPALYSSSLSGVVVLTPSGHVKVNQEIFRNASMSTEFHFDQIQKQIEGVQSELAEVNESKLKAGDFFITRHSNLSQAHVIFHLISDEASNSPEEINSRHPVILGLRNVLKMASRYDVTNLSIPALLRHDMSEDMTVPWCVRRAELVFKCAKGLMIESATWGGSELSTLQLVLPRDISEELFTVLANMVPHVFRLSNAKIFST